MHCEICDYSTTGLSDYANQVTHTLRKKVNFYPKINKYLCTDCVHIQREILRIYEDDEVHNILNEVILNE